MRKTWSVAFLLMAFAVAPLLANDDAVLTIGDPVPAIDIAHFFQGTPVTSFDKQKI